MHVAFIVADIVLNSAILWSIPAKTEKISVGPAEKKRDFKSAGDSDPVIFKNELGTIDRVNANDVVAGFKLAGKAATIGGVTRGSARAEPIMVVCVVPVAAVVLDFFEQAEASTMTVDVVTIAK